MEPLRGDRAGQHSIRINDQYRVCFYWKDGYADEVEITDYHLSLGSWSAGSRVIFPKRSVTPDTALRLARVLGMSADFWLGLQQDWDLWHAMHSSEAAEIDQLVPLRRQA